MKLILILSIFSLSTFAVCPFKSPSLDELLSQARRLEESLPIIDQCREKIDVESHVQKISNSAQGIHKLFNTLSNVGTSEITIDSLNEIEINSALNSISELSTIITNRHLNDACSNVYHSGTFWSSLLGVFNELSPYFMSLSASLAPYTLAVQATGGILKHILDADIQERERYSMASHASRESFIQSSCLIYELGANTHALDSALEFEDNVIKKQRDELEAVGKELSNKLFNNPDFLSLLIAEMKQINDDIMPLINEAVDQPGGYSPTPLPPNSQPKNGSDNGFPVAGNDQPYNPYNSYQAPNFSRPDTKYICKLTKKYLTNRVSGYSRLERLNSYLIFLSRREELQGNELNAIKMSFNIEILENFINDNNTYKDHQTGQEIFICELGNIKKVFDVFNKVVDNNSSEQEVTIDIFKDFKSSLNEHARITFNLKLLEKKFESIRRLAEENIDIDLSEIYLLEKSLVNALFSQKRFGYYWLEQRAERGLDHIEILKKKIRAKEYKSISNPKLQCGKITQTLRDYNVARRILNGSSFYCHTMSFLTSKTEHPHYTFACSHEHPKTRYVSYHTHFGRVQSHVSKTGRLDKALVDIEKDVESLKRVLRNNKCYAHEIAFE